MKNELRKIAKQYPKRVGRALFQEGEAIMLISKRDFVPVDTGNLRATGAVEPPEFEDDVIRVRLVYGGPAALYAWTQHERLDYFHEVGQAKYLERPLMDRVPVLARNVAKNAKL